MSALSLSYAKKSNFSRFWRCNGRKITGPIGIDTGHVFPRRFRSLLFRVDARGTSPPYFYLLFLLLPSSLFLSSSAPYFIVSRALCPLKRPDYKRPINSFILFAPGPPFSSLFPKIERRYSRPHSFFFFSFLVHPRRHRRPFAFYLFHRRSFGRGHIIVNWPPRRRKKE